MIPFKTTPEQIKEIPQIAMKMLLCGLDIGFVNEAANLAKFDQGIFDLMDLWDFSVGCEEERIDILADIKDLLNDYSPLK